MMGDNRAEYDATIYSEELRFSSKREEGRMFDWLVGLYTYSEKVDLLANYYSGMFSSDSEMDNWGAAIFAQGTLHIADRWHLTLGGRLDHARLDGKKTLLINNPMFPVNADLDDSLKYTEFLPSANLAFDITKDMTAYAKISKGYMAGGFDNYFAGNDKDYTYDPEYSWNYELGLKSKLLDDTLIVNVSAFQIDTKDKQVTEWRTNAMDRYILNAAKARARGLELDVQYMPTPGLLLYASAGYLNSELKNWETKVDPFNYDGKKTPGSPEWSYSVGVRYRWENGFMVGTEVQGVSHYYTDVKNYHSVDGRAVVNAQVGYEGESFDVILWAKNLFNKDYQENKWDYMSDGNLLVQQGEPLSFGLRFTYRF
ncbi:MAG: TonB-dependent receptor [Deltaproteobacteria bacterium]|jgi:iron complex outermembrane receptor protein|nr:TonB-dependent receptor [Deltaproteobacteria bacterium]